MPLGKWCVGRSPGLNYIYVSKSCLVRIVRFVKKMLYYDMDSFNASNGAPHLEYYEFKWVGSMITCVKLFIKKKKKILLELFLNILIAHWFITSKGFIILHEILHFHYVDLYQNSNQYQFLHLYKNLQIITENDRFSRL